MEYTGWDNLTTQQASELLSHLPPNLEGLVIQYTPYGSVFIDALSQWIKTAKQVKYIQIFYSCVGRFESGKHAGIGLAEALAVNDLNEKVVLKETDLIGSRNAPNTGQDGRIEGIILSWNELLR